jgi:hypothetical protein
MPQMAQKMTIAGQKTGDFGLLFWIHENGYPKMMSESENQARTVKLFRGSLET